jgi:hypothetical protein
MAARTQRTNLDGKWRDKIQASMLLNRLSDNALGKLKSEMTSSQVKSAEILLRKCLPDLSATTVSGDPDAPIITEIRETIIDPKRNP